MRRSNLVKYALVAGLVSVSIGKYFYDIRKNDEQRTAYFRALKEGEKIEGESWGVNAGPIYTRGVAQCGVCVFFRENIAGMSHYGFNLTTPTPVDLKYVHEMVKKIGGKEGLEAIVVGGDDDYLNSLKQELERSGIKIRETWCDYTKIDEDKPDAGKIVLADPKTKTVSIIDEDNGQILKTIKY